MRDGKNVISQVTLTPFVILTFLVSILLHICAISSQTWYVLSMDLNKCQSCGRLIVEVGSMMENSTLTSYRNVKDVSIETTDIGSNFTDELREQGLDNESDTNIRFVFNDSSTLTFFGDDPGDVYESYIDKFVIEQSLHVYMGLWMTSVCTKTGNRCIDIDVQQANHIFKQLKHLLSMQDGVVNSRLFLLVGLSVSIFTLFLMAVDLSISRSQAALVAACGQCCSAISTLAAVVIAILPYYQMASTDDVITPSLPCALVMAAVSAYLQIFNVCSVFRKSRVVQYVTLQDWSSKQFKII